MQKYIAIFSGFFNALVILLFLFFPIRQDSVIVDLTIIGDSRQDVLHLLLDAIRQGQVGPSVVDSNYTFSQTCKFIFNNHLSKLMATKTLTERKIHEIFTGIN